MTSYHMTRNYEMNVVKKKKMINQKIAFYVNCDCTAMTN